MSEQYYYLLNGQEQGPFSRAAIESLLQSGKLAGAFLRSTPDQPWQAAEELGLAASASPSPAAAPAAGDPASVVFRSHGEINQSGGMAGPILAIGLLAALIGGGWWAITTKPSLNNTSNQPRRSAEIPKPSILEHMLEGSGEIQFCRYDCTIYKTFAYKNGVGSMGGESGKLVTGETALSRCVGFTFQIEGGPNLSNSAVCIAKAPITAGHPREGDPPVTTGDLFARTQISWEGGTTSIHFRPLANEN